MDRRKMRKMILVDALEEYQRLPFNEWVKKKRIAVLLDKEPQHVTQATIRRYDNLLQEMVENAESKLD